MDLGSITGGMSARVDAPSSTSSSATQGGAFARVIDQVMDRITAPSHAAEQAVSDLALGKTDNLHQVLLAVSQADLAFRLLLEIRNKLTEAYQEIQRMQV